MQLWEDGVGKRWKKGVKEEPRGEEEDNDGGYGEEDKDEEVNQRRKKMLGWAGITALSGNQ